MRWGRRGGRAGPCVGGLAPASQLAPFRSPQPDAVAGSEAPRRLVLQPGHRGESQRAAEGSQGHRSGRNQGEAQAPLPPLPVPRVPAQQRLWGAARRAAEGAEPTPWPPLPGPASRPHGGRAQEHMKELAQWRLSDTSAFGD